MGGVLEHPITSLLWKQGHIPKPGGPTDDFGGYTISVDQSWWGYPARKKTLFYICGCHQKDLPPIPISFDAITHTVSGQNSKKRMGKHFTKYKLKEVSKADRSKTVEPLCMWLAEVAELCRKQK